MKTEQQYTGEDLSVCSSHRATLRVRVVGLSKTLKVARYESNVSGVDPSRVSMPWSLGCSLAENYRRAVEKYLVKANWGGQWVVSTITDGAVAVCLDAVPYPELRGTK